MVWGVFPKKQRGFIQIPQLRPFWFGGRVKPSFEASLTTSLNVSRSKGSGTPTFTRATTAYVEDFEGLLKPVLSGEARFKGARRVRNLFTVPENTATWTVGATASITTGQTDPNGGTTAFALNFPASGDNISSGIVFATGDVVVPSCYIKADSAGTIRFVEGASGTWDQALNVTTSWQRLSAPAGTVAAGGAKTFMWQRNGAGQLTKIYVWHPQAELVTGQSNQNPSEYVSVGVLSAPYHGANVDGVKYFDYENGNTVASNVVTEARGATISTSVLLGYLAEGARTNRCLYSQTLENAAWTASNMTVDDASATAPDGTSTATTLTATAGNATLIQDLGVVASAAKAGGLWIKRKTGTGNIDLTLDGGATWTNVTVTAGWTRVQKTQTLANEDFGIRIVTNTDAVYVWNGQVETASFLSTDIPTTTLAVARNADILQYAGAGNINTAAGVFYAEWTTAIPGAVVFILCGDSTGGSYPLYVSGAAKQGATDGTQNCEVAAASTLPTTSVQKGASAWGGASMAAVTNGGTVATTAFDGLMNMTNVQIGAQLNANQPFGTIRNARIYSRALSNAQLQAMTT